MTELVFYRTTFPDVYNAGTEARQDLDVMAVASRHTSTVWVGGYEFDPLRATALAEALTAAVGALTGDGAGVLADGELSLLTPTQREWDMLNHGGDHSGRVPDHPLAPPLRVVR